MKKKEEELVIPLITKNKWRSEDAPSSSFPHTKKDDKKSAKSGDKKSASEKLENLSLEQQAARELIEDSKRQLEVRF